MTEVTAVTMSRNRRMGPYLQNSQRESYDETMRDEDDTTTRTTPSVRGSPEANHEHKENVGGLCHDDGYDGKEREETIGIGGNGNGVDGGVIGVNELESV